jgi:DNA-binding beta-propeller fold protein YncE
MKKQTSDELLVKRRRVPKFISPFIFALVAGLLLPGLAGAAGGWQWQFNLVSPELKNPFLMPTSLYIETESKRFYVVDSGQNSLHSFQFDGKYLSTFNPEGALQQPFAMVRDRETEQLWVVEKGRNSLTKIDLKAKALAPQVLKYRGTTVYPDRLALVSDKLYVLDKLTGNIIEYGFDLQASVVFEGSGNGFIDFVVNEAGLWALDGRLKKVLHFDMGGKLKNEISLGDQVSFPVALEVGPSGFLYVVDKHAGTVVVFDTAGNFKYTFLEKGHGDNKLYYPEDILFDPLGRLCVVDTGNGRVAVFSR